VLSCMQYTEWGGRCDGVLQCAVRDRKKRKGNILMQNKFNDCTSESTANFLKITCSRWPPWHQIQCHNHCLKFCIIYATKHHQFLTEMRTRFISWG